MSVTAFIFPGQGSQSVGMAGSLLRDFRAAREVFEEASEAAGFDLAALCAGGPPEKLDQTPYTQPAVLTASLAALRVLSAEIGRKPDMAAGHSLGEYTALVAAGVISLADAVRAVHRRGHFMADAVPEGRGAMAAIMKLGTNEVEDICRQASQDGLVEPANDNAPGQIVVSGERAGVEKAVELAKARGGLGRMLKVSGPFHSRLMSPAAERMKDVLASINYGAFAFPVVANVDAKPYSENGAVMDRLVGQITSPVRWRETLLALAAMGAEVFIEVGPGSVLKGLVNRTLPESEVLSMSESEHLENLRRLQ